MECKGGVDRGMYCRYLWAGVRNHHFANLLAWIKHIIRFLRRILRLVLAWQSGSLEAWKL